MPSTYVEKLETKFIAKLVQNGDFAVVEGLVIPSSLAWYPHGDIFSSMLHLYRQGIEITKNTIQYHMDANKTLVSFSTAPSKDYKQKRGVDALNQLSSMVVDETIETLSMQMRDFSGRRNLLPIAKEIETRALNGDDPASIIADVDMKITKIASTIGISSTSIKTSREATESLARIYEDAKNNGSKYLKTGLLAWDRYTRGLYPGRLYMIAGTSGQGKSTLAQNIIHSLSVKQGIMGGSISLELSEEEVTGRLLRMETGINPSDIEEGIVKNISLFRTGLAKLRDAPILHDNSTELTVGELRVKILKMVELGAKYIVIDQLDQLSTGTLIDAQYNRGNVITYKIKGFARDIFVPIILCHQMNKSADSIQRKDKFNTSLADLKESGQNAPDAIVFTRRNDEMSALIWEKARQGFDGEKFAQVEFDTKMTLFKDATRDFNIPDEFSGDANE